MPEFIYDWFSPNIPILTEHLGVLRDRPTCALEIGCYDGRATVWLLDHILTHPGSWITCVDTFQGSNEHAEMGVDFSGVRARFEKNTEGRPVTTCVGRSDEWLFRLSGPFQLIYVDGSHLAADVLTDACLAWLRLARGGLMVFDDYGWDRYQEPHKNPRLAIDAFLSCFSGRYELLHQGYQVIVRKA